MGKNAVMETLEFECPDCGGTGIYRGYNEPAGTGVVCTRCKGTGMAILQYREFTGRVRCTDIQMVRVPGVSVPPESTSPWVEMSYEDWLQSRMPKDK